MAILRPAQGPLRHPVRSPARAWWKAARPQGWLFPGQNPVNPLTARQLNRARHAAAQMAELDKPVSLHTPRYERRNSVARAAFKGRLK
jgi:hypothetical protein